MKKTSLLAMLVVVAFSLAACGEEPASAKAELVIGYAKDYAATSREKVDAVFHSKRHKFIDATEPLGAGGLRMLRFRGDTVALNMFIAELSRCDSVTVDVLFRKPPESGKPNIELPHFLRGADWVVHKPAGRNSFVIRINVASKNFDFEKFVFPQIRNATDLMTGYSKPTTSLATGMKMQDAVSAMNDRGIDAQQMAYATSHNAFNLPDGRTAVLIGNKMVDEIQIIANPKEPKSKRETESVATFAF